jgi:hypothetical protein
MTREHGYELMIADDDLDAATFERLMRSGQRGLAEVHPAAAVSPLSEGLALWRGAFAADVPVSPGIAAEAARLERVRLTALEARVEARLDLGGHAEAGTGRGGRTRAGRDLGVSARKRVRRHRAGLLLIPRTQDDRQSQASRVSKRW